MKVGIIGMGKLGLPVALAIESKGHEVVGYDVSPLPAEYIQDRKIPYMEEGTDALLERTNIKMAYSVAEVVGEADLVFCAVQTPHAPEYEGVTRLPDERADFDYSYLIAAVQEVQTAAQQQSKPTHLVIISTCLPGTFEREIRPWLDEDVMTVTYNPFFIAMGTVVENFLNPEFVLMGGDATGELADFYSTLHHRPVLITDITTAEGIKVFYNTFITMKTVLGNMYGEMAHKIGMDVDAIYEALALSTDRLMSPKYLRAGVGDGGGCHPRDNIALSYIAEKVGLSHNIFEDLMHARESHMEFIADLAIEQSEQTGFPIVVIGRSFKPETWIETGSASVLLVNILREKGREVNHVNKNVMGTPCVFVIGTAKKMYAEFDYSTLAPGSVIIDPFRYIPDQEGCTMIRIGELNAES